MREVKAPRSISQVKKMQKPTNISEAKKQHLPYFEIYNDGSGRKDSWRFRLVGANHEKVTWGEGYSSEASARRATETVARLSAQAINSGCVFLVED